VSAFAPLLDLLAEVPDPRRAEGKLYNLPHVLLFSILAVIAGSNSYRGIVTFIDVHRIKSNPRLEIRAVACPFARHQVRPFHDEPSLCTCPIFGDHLTNPSTRPKKPTV
jgi:hypothetical protein